MTARKQSFRLSAAAAAAPAEPPTPSGELGGQSATGLAGQLSPIIVTPAAADDRPEEGGGGVSVEALEWTSALAAAAAAAESTAATTSCQARAAPFGPPQPPAGGPLHQRPRQQLWVDKTLVRHFMRLCSIASLVSVCANTTKTFAHYPHLVLATFVVDLLTGLVFSLEICLKVRARRLFRGPHALARDPWFQFDAAMVLFIWVSVVLQLCEMAHLVKPYSVLSVLRSPRPLVLVRFIRIFFKFRSGSSCSNSGQGFNSMSGGGGAPFSSGGGAGGDHCDAVASRNREEQINNIFKRSSQQIYNVTLFFLFFMTLYGLLGVQLFGQIEKHCVLNGTTLDKLTVNDLALPDTHCSGSPHYGNQCPLGMVCLDLHLPKEIVGFNGFDHIGHSLYTVYQTSSQEGWAHLMYSTFDHYPAWKVAAYFVSLIFFLGWMVRNVFIAVFTETFNEIRVQFEEIWGSREGLAGEGVPRVFRGDDAGWRLVELDDTSGTPAWVPAWARRFQNSATFQVLVLVALLANVTLAASIKFEHDGRPREDFYMHTYWWEVGFTCLFNLEALFKMACLGPHCYWTRTSHRFELLLALGTTGHVLSPQLYMTELADFQVLRVIRLIKASPVLEDFAYKSFGPGRKLGSLVMFTVCLLVVTSAMTMQLFCSLGEEYHRFDNFPYAFMSMFQILTQEAWTEIMNETMLRVGDTIGPYVAVYFILYHLFVSLIVLSLFVAVILDNLELPEDLKKAKQEKAREQIACISEELPLRLRLFEQFPDSPQMTKLRVKLTTTGSAEFNVPKVRESFMRQFVDVDAQNLPRRASIIKNCLRAGMMPAPHVDLLTGRPTNISFAAGGALATSASVRRSLKTKLRQANMSLGSGGGGGRHNHLSRGEQQPARGAQAQRLQLTRKGLAQPAHERHVEQQQQQQSQVLRYRRPAQHSLRLGRPSIRLLSGPPKSPAPKRELLRKSTISQLIEESNLQRMSLMQDVGGLVSPGSLGGGGGGGLGAHLNSQLRFRGDHRPTSSATTTTMAGGLHQSASYDHLRGGENGSGGGGVAQEISGRNPQELNIKMLKRKRQQAELKRSQRERDLRENHPLFDTPLFLVGRESRLRKFCQLLAWSRYQYRERDPITGKLRKSQYKSLHQLLGLVSYFDWLMLTVTSLSCVSMMFETPTMRLTNTPALRLAEYTFVGAMTLELTLKVLAQGLVFTPRALLASVAGCLDSFILVTSLAYACWMPHEVEPQSLAQYLMLLRCIRPLRVFSLIPHMRQVVYELVRGFKAIFLVCVLLALLCFVFACYGVHIFGGRLGRCTDPTVLTRQNCTGTFLRRVFVTKMNVPIDDDQSYPALLVPRVWANPHRFSFDDIKSAMLALFEVLSFKGWVDIREALLRRFDNSPHWLYIHIFVFFGCMVGVTLFVGVVIANYGENKGTALLTAHQRRWCDLKKRLKIAQPLHLPPRPDHVRLRALIYDLIQHLLFKRTIAVLVLCNSSLLIVHWDSHTVAPAAAAAAATTSGDAQPAAASDMHAVSAVYASEAHAVSALHASARGNATAEDSADGAHAAAAAAAEAATASQQLSFATISAWLTCAFAFEVVMKMIAFTPRGYWQSRRNRYDLAVTLIGCLWVLMHFVAPLRTVASRDLSNSFGFVVVILRFFTITGKHATLQMLMLTVVVSVYKSFFIILGLFVLVLFYSLLGVQLFGSVKYGENLSRQANFKSAKLGIITMFRIVTGEDWYRMMHDCMIMPPYCTRGQNYWETDCGHLGISFAFFSSFYIIITHVVLNLLVAVIMENFSLFYSSDQDPQISYADIRHFQNIWNMVDLHQRGYIPVRRVKFVLRLLEGRLKPPPDLDGRNLIKHMCHEMERLHNGDDVSFHDVLSMLALRTVEIDKSLQFEELMARQELENIIEEEVAKKTIRSWLDQCLRRLRHQRQQANSLIQGLRLTNLGGVGPDPFLLSPLPPTTTAGASDSSTATGAGGPQGAASAGAGAPSASSGDHSPLTPRPGQLTVAGGHQSHFGAFASGGRLPSCSGSESQHSITSAATIATIAASIGKLKRRVEASRSESNAAAAAAAAAASAARASSGGGGSQRKLLGAQAHADHAKKEERAQQLRRAVKALTSPANAAAAATSNKTGGPFSLGQPPPHIVMSRQVDTEAVAAAEEAARQLKQQQYLPKLNSAINDIHQWWDFQIAD